MPSSPHTPNSSCSHDFRSRLERTQRLICIIAAQRAGTTALQHEIRAAGVVNYGEIFHPEPLKNATGTFLRFAEEQNIRLVETTTRAGTAVIAERYLGWLSEQAAPEDFLIDVKLNSWSVLSPWWKYPHREPLFLAQLKRRRAIFVVIWRDNLGDQVLSHFIANQFGIWHDLTQRKVAGRTIQAPVARLRKLALTISRAESDMLDHLQDYPGKIVIRYEDLFEEGVLTERFRNRFRRIAGIELPRGDFAGVRPSSADKRAIIDNYEEVIAAIKPISERRRHQFEARMPAP
jgi:hypothetical protein